MIKNSSKLLFALVVTLAALSLVKAATCYCNSCTSCTADLNNPACTNVILTQDIHLTSDSQACLQLGSGFKNKIFNCQGHGFIAPTNNLYITPLPPYNGTINITLNSATWLNDTIKNCMFVNTTIGIRLHNAQGLRITNQTFIHEALFISIINSSNISIINITGKNGGCFFDLQMYHASLLALPTPPFSIEVKNVRLINFNGAVGTPAPSPGIISINIGDKILFDNLTVINISGSTSTYRLPIFWAQTISGIKIIHWTAINSSPLEFWTWDMLFSNVENLNMPTLYFEPIYTWNYNNFINITADGFEIWSSPPGIYTFTFIPGIVMWALAYSNFKNIRIHSFSTTYAYKCNFTNMTIYNGTGFVFDSFVWTTDPSEISVGNRLVNLTLINNTNYDFSILAPIPTKTCIILRQNIFKNIKSNDGRPILITDNSSQTITGKYAEIYACLNDSTLKNVDVEASPSLNNDGIYLTNSYRDVFINVNSSNNYIGVVGNTYNLNIINSSFNNNQVGCQLEGNLSASNTHFDRNKQYGLVTRWLKNSKFVNDSFVDNKQYDIYPIGGAPSLSFSLSICDGSLTFKNERLSGNKGLGIFNTSTTYENKEYAEAVVCGKNIRLNNVTILGNKNLKNNGLLVLNSSYVSMNNINANNVYQGVLLYYSNHTAIANSSFSNDMTNGVKIYNPIFWVASLVKWVNKPGYNTLQNITTEYDDIGVYLYSSSNTLNNISACFDKKVSFYFDGHSSNNVGADNTGNVTDLGTNPGFSADAGICYLSLLKPVFVPPTPANNSILSSTSIALNATSADPTLTNITLNLYNNTGLVQKVICTSSPCSYTFTGLKLNQNYYFNATACDAEKQCASTGTYTTYLSPTTCTLVLVVKNHLNKALYIDAVKIGSGEYDVGHVLLLPYQTKTLKIENNGFCRYLGRVVFLDMTLYFSDASHMTYEVSGEIALNS